MEQVTQTLMEWLKQAPGLEALDNEIISDLPHSLALTLNSVKEMKRERDILGKATLRAQLDYALRLVLPLERKDPGKVEENRSRLDQLTGWICRQGGGELPPALGREANLIMSYPRLEEQREGVGIYSASLLLTTTFDLEEEEWN